MKDSYYDYREDNQYSVAYEEDGHYEFFETDDCIEARAMYNRQKSRGHRTQFKNNWYDKIWDDDEENWR